MNEAVETKKAKNPDGMVRLTLILFAICAVTALLLGLVNYITADRIEAIKFEKTQAALQAVMPSTGDPAAPYVFGEIVYDYANPNVAAVYTARDESGEVRAYVVECVVSGSQGNIDMVVGVDTEGAVTGVSIIDMSETSGLGTKANDESWRAQFVGASEAQAVDKDGGAIDALTGATVTSRAVTEGVNIALETAAEAAALG